MVEKKKTKKRKLTKVPVSEIETYFPHLLKEMEKRISGTLTHVENKLDLKQTSIADETKLLRRHINNLNKRISELTKLVNETDATLSNVLLAIRQNQFAQAWYPEQQGYPEMHVVGKHPCQAK